MKQEIKERLKKVGKWALVGTVSVVGVVLTIKGGKFIITSIRESIEKKETIEKLFNEYNQMADKVNNKIAQRDYFKDGTKEFIELNNEVEQMASESNGIFDKLRKLGVKIIL